MILRAVFGVTEGPRLERLREELRRLLDLATDPIHGIVLLTLGPQRITRIPRFRRELERVNTPIYEEIAERRAAGDLTQREDIMSAVAGSHPRGRLPDER